MMANSMAAVVMFSAMFTLLTNTEAIANVQDMYFDRINYRFNVIRAGETDGGQGSILRCPLEDTPSGDDAFRDHTHKQLRRSP